MDWFDLLAVQGTFRSLLQYHSSKASILWCSAIFIVQFSYISQYNIFLKTANFCKTRVIYFPKPCTFHSHASCRVENCSLGSECAGSGVCATLSSFSTVTLISHHFPCKWHTSAGVCHIHFYWENHAFTLSCCARGNSIKVVLCGRCRARTSLIHVHGCTFTWKLEGPAHPPPSVHPYLKARCRENVRTCWQVKVEASFTHFLKWIFALIQ